MFNLREHIGFDNSPGRVNMTPIIDIVFLLIIFFMLVCQFIGAENFEVTVPDNCQFAKPNPEPGAQVTTITIMKDGPSDVLFAVGSEKITTDRTIIAKKIKEALDLRLSKLSPDQRMVRLRIDKDIRFYDVQYALAAIAESSATNIELAALKNARVTTE